LEQKAKTQKDGEDVLQVSIIISIRDDVQSSKKGGSGMQKKGDSKVQYDCIKEVSVLMVVG
jgi:hypothetical protein